MFKAPSGQAGTLTNNTLYSDALITNPAPKYDILISEKQNKYQDINNKMHLVGSVTNNATKPMNFQLIAGIYDENGNCLDANSVQFPIPLNPGETIPYDFIMWGAMDYVPAAYEAAFQSKIFINWISTNEAYSKSYTIITKDNTKTYEGNVGKFNGIVVNNSGYDLSTVVVLVTIYDKISKELIATNYAYVTESMINNASGTYEVYLYPSDDIDPTNFDTVINAFGQ
jgi:hypothetical protein